MACISAQRASVRSPSVWEGGGGWRRGRLSGAVAGSGPRFERERSRGARCLGSGGADGEAREMVEALREGGPRKREGGGSRWWWGVAAEDGDNVDILSGEMSNSI